MKWKLSTAIIILCIALSSGCKNDTALNLAQGNPGSFSYTAYDSSGTPLVQGQLLFDIKDSTIDGSWQLSKIGNAKNTGPQVGSGTLKGTIQNKTLFINLNPGWADNNVFLVGTIDNKMFQGSWTWSTFIGPTNGGRFEALTRAPFQRQQ